MTGKCNSYLDYKGDYKYSPKKYDFIDLLKHTNGIFVAF